MSQNVAELTGPDYELNLTWKKSLGYYETFLASRSLKQTLRMRETFEKVKGAPKF